MLNANELKVKQLLEEAIEEYGVEHVDIDADYDKYGNEVLSIYYHSYRNSFGIGDNIPLGTVDSITSKGVSIGGILYRIK